MLKARFDTKQLNSMLKNTVQYGYGFLEGAEIGQIEFNIRLGEYVVDVLNHYIDKRATMHPETLHHIYEWGQVGDPSARLFSMRSIASKRVIKFDGKFLKSSSIGPTATEPFVNKAEVMENGIGVTISPKNGDFLVFDVGDETIFTMNDIYVAHPGGPAVEAGFANVIEEFFGSYFTGSLLKSSGLFDHLSTAEEFAQYFPSGARRGKAVGRAAGKKYMTFKGAPIE